MSQVALKQYNEAMKIAGPPRCESCNNNVPLQLICCHFNAVVCRQCAVDFLDSECGCCGRNITKYQINDIRNQTKQIKKN